MPATLDELVQRQIGAMQIQILVLQIELQKRDERIQELEGQAQAHQKDAGLWHSTEGPGV
jgi:hypothetical protein